MNGAGNDDGDDAVYGAGDNAADNDLDNTGGNSVEKHYTSANDKFEETGVSRKITNKLILIIEAVNLDLFFYIKTVLNNLFKGRDNK